jgi:adenosylcobinamide-GDP ribazoletransferase|tara:strand:- start:475 stop:1260 length:786 start_codon:yes stop_codon:yes gene_type:complete
MDRNEKRFSKSSPLIRKLQGLQTAFTFLTLVPVGKRVDFSQMAIRESLFWYPLVGCFLGVLGFLFTEYLLVPDYLVAVFILTLWLLLTGALHIDGIADCADAWTGGLGSRERTLEIMKDPRCGAMGVVAIVATLLLKMSALVFVLQVQGAVVIVLAPLLARISVVALFGSTSYVGSGPIGQAIALLSSRRVAATVILWIVLCFLLFPVGLLATTLLVTVLVHFLLSYFSRRRLQGFTGDCAGALIEITEIGVLLIGGFYLY